MAKDVRVLLIEDDLYSREMMAMLLTRDWRTRVVGELKNLEEVSKFLAQPLQNVDVILVGLESPVEQTWPFRIFDEISSIQNPPVILYAATKVEESFSLPTRQNIFGGYVLKNEVVYTLASAVVLAARGKCVISPSVISKCDRSTCEKPVVIIDGTRKVANFSKRESEIVHLGILFNMSQRDIADELVIGTDWVSEAMSNVYEKLGLHQILTGEVPLRDIFDDETVLENCEKILDRARKNSKSGKPRKAPWMSTLAFHLLTTPIVEEM